MAVLAGGEVDRGGLAPKAVSFTSQEWAQCYLEKYPGAVRVSSIAEVSELLRTPEAVESDTSGRRQMAFGLG